MQVRQLTIGNFRGVQSGTVNFNGDALLVGGNSVGKSTVCEALDLVLGPERMFRRPVVDEWDFWGAQYRPTDDDHLREIRIDVVITDLHEVAQRRFGATCVAGIVNTDPLSRPPRMAAVRTKGSGACPWDFGPDSTRMRMTSMLGHSSYTHSGLLMYPPMAVNNLVLS